jgi:hypothetical protein
VVIAAILIGGGCLGAFIVFLGWVVRYGRGGKRLTHPFLEWEKNPAVCLACGRGQRYWWHQPSGRL